MERHSYESTQDPRLSIALRRLRRSAWLAGLACMALTIRAAPSLAQNAPPTAPAAQVPATAPPAGPPGVQAAPPADSTAVQATPPAPPADAPAPLPDVAPVTGSAVPANAESPPPAIAAPPAASELELSVGGGMILYWYQPFENRFGGTRAQNNFEVFEAKLRIDAQFGRFGLHILPIVRDTKERSFFPGVAWIQETYAFAKLEPVTIKVGKVFAQLGRFWDNSFYGNAQEYDGLKLDPNVGVSIEGDVGPKQDMGLKFFAQYFIIDGVTNYSLAGRDTISIEGARRRNYAVGRVEPFVRVGDITTLKLGLSGGYFQADIPGFAKQPVGRLAIDGTVMVENFTAWAEYSHQFGNQLETSPFAGTDPNTPYQKADWVMVGGEYTYGRFTLRYNFNLGSYSPIEYKETRHVPGFAVALDEHLFVLLEYAFAQRHNAGKSALLDSSLNLTIHGKV
jgi:hypothetical protein